MMAGTAHFEVCFLLHFESERASLSLLYYCAEVNIPSRIKIKLVFFISALR